MNGLDLAITVLVLIGLIKGLFDGVIKQVISLLALVIAIFCAGTLAVPLRDGFLSFPFIAYNIHPYIVSGICYLLVFAFIILILNWLGKLVSKAINVTPAGFLNKGLGALFGAFMVILSISLLFMLITFFDPDSKIIAQKTKQESVLYKTVETIVPTLYPIIRELLN